MRWELQSKKTTFLSTTGNQSLGMIPGHNCSNERDIWWWDWRPVACLSGEKTPYLGTYYREEAEPVLDTEARYDVRSRAAKKSRGTGEAKGSRDSYDGGVGGDEEPAGGVKVGNSYFPNFFIIIVFVF